MKCFLGISNFLEEISSLSHSIVDVSGKQMLISYYIKILTPLMLQWNFTFFWFTPIFSVSVTDIGSSWNPVTSMFWFFFFLGGGHGGHCLSSKNLKLLNLIVCIKKELNILSLLTHLTNVFIMNLQHFLITKHLQASHKQFPIEHVFRYSDLVPNSSCNDFLP